MTSELPVVIAISLKSTRLGIAVFRGEYLLYYSLINLISRHKSRFLIAEENLSNFVNNYRPTLIAIEQLVYSQQKTVSLIRMYQSVKRAAEMGNLQVKTGSPNDVIMHFSPNRKRSKRKIAIVLAGCYPELRRLLNNCSKRQQSYVMPLFNAIALGLYTVRQLRK